MISSAAHNISFMERQPRTLSQADRVAQRNLKRIWEAKRRELGLTQQKVADEFDRTQGLIGQYLNGHIALGPVAVLRFARILQCTPTEIRPDFTLGNIIPSEMPEDVAEVAVKLAALPKIARLDFIRSINQMIENGVYIQWVINTHEKANGVPQTENT